ncbi:MAG: transcription antitermination factor NusB [Acidimicrobiales bacterium]|nr:transcription antitermination factor NusB [Acidimicrobiales bacterium]
MSISARQVALDALDRIERDGAYANLVLPELLERTGLAARDRHFATELVYGTTRMRRACDFLVDRFLTRDLDLRVRNALRLGAYQLHFLQMAPHAAVGETVEVAPKAARSLVNAVLRRVSAGTVEWPDDATRLSYPDWMVGRLAVDLGEVDALRSLEVMNTAPSVTERADGYVQDLASQWVAEAVGAAPGERVVDLCAAPGGKALLLAASGARVVASDIRPGRARLVAANALGRAELPVVVADAVCAPFRPASFDAVLVDAPCSGLGVLRRRPDARWRVDADAPERLGGVQRALVDAACALVRPGGRLVYSVCTLTDAEGLAIDRHLADAAGFEAEPPPDGPWRPRGRGALLLPQDADTDGMYLLRLRRTPDL